MPDFRPLGKPTFKEIDDRRREEFPYEKDGDPDLNLRLRRSVSWLGRAEEFYYSDRPDLDLAFTCYWIAFNALYDKDPYLPQPPAAKDAFGKFFETVIGYDDERTIFNEIWQNFSGPIWVLLNNQFVFEPFWKHHNGVAGFENWQGRFEQSKSTATRALAEGNIKDVLCVLFERLYVLRKQVVHGNSTWSGGRGNDQLRDSANIMAFLLPLFITLIMDNWKMDLGKPYYRLPAGVPGVSPIKDN